MKDTRPLAKTEQIATHLQVSPRTMDDWASRGVGPPFIRVQGQRRYSWQAVERWVEERTQVPAGAAS